MINSNQIQELKPNKLIRIAKEATSAGFANALKTKLSIVYTEGNMLVERLPNGEKRKLTSLKRKKQTLTNKFKLK
jgi:hypothetical protein